MIVDVQIGHHRKGRRNRNRNRLDNGHILKLVERSRRRQNMVIVGDEAICWRPRAYQRTSGLGRCGICMGWRQDSSTRLCDDGAYCLDGARVF